MPTELHDAAQVHIDSIHDLIEHLIAECGDRYTTELHDHVKNVLKSFDRYRKISTDPSGTSAPPDRCENISVRNYLAAQLPQLLAFAHEISNLDSANRLPAVDALVDDLWLRMGECHEVFFGTPLFRKR